MNAPNHERIMELLAESAVFQLDDQDQHELNGLMSDSTGVDEAEFEMAAAMLELSSLPKELEPMPSQLAKDIEAVAHRDFANSSVEQGHTAIQVPRDDSATVRRIVQWTGWVVAAGLLIALTQMGIPSGSNAVEPTVAQLRDRLIQAGGKLIQRDWQSTKDVAATGATGDVVWNNDKQEGYMRIGGLAVNDPTVEQYQLWIFDETQNNPIDGGVFDMTPDGEAIIPISAKLGVKKPTLFAITVEKPGGVVVSDRKRVVMTAAPESM
ncbi:MAG: anti-sigma factor [Planctomycetota bacterium]